MSRSPSGTSASSSSSSSACRRWARKAPRRWIPTSAGACRTGIALDDLVRDARQRSPHVLLAEDDLLVALSIVSFLASRDRVKGAAAMFEDAVTASQGAVTGSVRLLAVALAAWLGPAHQRRARATLREGHLDRVEVARRLGRREHRARLLAQLARRRSGSRRASARAASPRRRAPARPPGGAVLCEVWRARSASSSVNVASWTSRSAWWAAIASVSQGAVSPEITTLRPSRVGPHHLLGRDAPDRLPALQAAEVRPRLDTELLRPARGRIAPGASSSRST